MPFWLVVPALIATAGYAIKKMTEDDDSSSHHDDYSSYEEERRRQEKAEKKARKAEKIRKIETLEIDFASTGEKYLQDITSSLKNLVFLHFENRGFSHTLVDGVQATSEQQILWANKYCTPETQRNLSFLVKNYALEIFPDPQFNKLSQTIDESMSAVIDLKQKKQVLEKTRNQLKKAAN